MGGMTSVGCNLVRASLSDANSEYRRRTSRSYTSSVRKGNHPKRGYFEKPRSLTYISSDGIHNITTAILWALSSVGDEDGQLGVLIKYLLDATIVASGFPPRN